MGRRRSEPGAEAFIRFLSGVPWWVGPICAVLAYLAFRVVLPAILAHVSSGSGQTINPFTTFLAPWSVRLAPLAGVFVLLLWGLAELTKLKNRRRLDKQTGLASIGDLSWAEFEELVAEAYRREGYAVERTGNASGDGGVDVILRRDGQTTLVQCKHWKTWRVRVNVVRELRGAMAGAGADYGIVVSYGAFTSDAAAFAEANRITLIGGNELVELIRSVQRTPRRSGSAPAVGRVQADDRPEPSSTASQVPPACPVCGSAMVRRTARRGVNAGSQFWGCPRYPMCQGTRPAN